MDKSYIKGFGRDYLLFCDGRVFSVKSNKYLKYKNTKGYLAVTLTKHNKSKKFYVSRLVATNFIPNPFNLHEVNHKDGNKTNNHVSNLEWCTRSQNLKHAFATGLEKPRYGEDNKMAKLIKRQVLEIRQLYPVLKNYAGLGRMFNVSYAQIKNIVTKKHWRHV